MVEAAEEALRLIRVEYEDLPVFFTPEEALAERTVLKDARSIPATRPEP